MEIKRRVSVGFVQVQSGRHGSFFFLSTNSFSSRLPPLIALRELFALFGFICFCLSVHYRWCPFAFFVCVVWSCNVVCSSRGIGNVYRESGDNRARGWNGKMGGDRVCGLTIRLNRSG